ncbi:MAG: NADPH:quinone reductase [Mycobacteriales bacterium]
MRAAFYRQAGGSDVLSLEDVAVPEPAAGEVRVRLRVAGVNPSDWKRRATAVPAGVQVPGQDGAGDVDAVGPGVDPGRVGERVWVWFAADPGSDARPARRWGTAAQWTVVPARQAVRLPAQAPYDLGAGLGIPAMTAWHCLFADGRLYGRTVLVAGGAGAVGNAAVALAARAGARVVATCSPGREAQVAAAGAHVVLDRTAADLAGQVRGVAPNGVDRVVEVALGANLALDLEVLAARGTVSTYADDLLTDLPVRRLMVGNTRLAFVLVYGLTDAELDAAARGVAEAVAAGALPAPPALRFPLEQVAAAHDAVQSGAHGKVLLDVPD